MLTRRHWFGVAAAAVAGAVLEPRTSAAAMARRVSGQQDAGGPRQRGSEDAKPAVGVRTTMSGPMDTDAYHSVVRAPKPDARPSMSIAERDALEHDLHCQCGCTLNVFTCRTTDFTCSVSPAMHHDVMQLVAGGYSRPEIMSAFRAAYGDRVLMAPVVEGFNRTAYVTPFLGARCGRRGRGLSHPTMDGRRSPDQRRCGGGYSVGAARDIRDAERAGATRRRDSRRHPAD